MFVIRARSHGANNRNEIDLIYIYIYIYLSYIYIAPNARERIMALSFIRANVLTRRRSYLRLFANASTMKVIMRSL